MTGTDAIPTGSLIQRNDKKFLFNKIGDEMVMMNMENGDFISLNAVGADIWELTREPVSQVKLIEELLRIYNIGEEKCRQEVEHFITTGMEQKMFIVPV